MVTIVLILGVLNLALGFAIALLAEHAALWLLPLLPGDKYFALDAAAADGIPAGTADDDDEPLPPIDPQGQPWPADWCVVLAEKQLAPPSAVEALLWVIHFELAGYREQLVECDQLLRSELATTATHQDWVAANDGWVRRLAALSSDFAQCKEDAVHDDLGDQLEDLLLDHSFHVQAATTSKPLASSDVQRAAVGELATQLDLVHQLQQRVDDLLATVLRRDDRYGVVRPQLLRDPLSRMPNRWGIDALFRQWWIDDPDRIRLVSCALFDIDRMHQINERFGVAAGDAAIAAFGELLKSLIRKERGFDRIGRYAGASYLVFLGDTAVGNAINGAERLRHSIEATSFKVGDQTFDLTASCGVVEIGVDEQPAEIFARLRRALAEAQKAGRNRTCADRGDGPQVAELPQYRVKGRVIEIACDGILPAAAQPA